MTDDQANALLGVLQAAYPHAKPMPGVTKSIWLSALGRHDYHRALRGVKRLILESKWYPSIAEANAAIEAESKGSTVAKDPDCYFDEEDLVSPQEIRAAIAPLLTKLRGEE